MKKVALLTALLLSYPLFAKQEISLKPLVTFSKIHPKTPHALVEQTLKDYKYAKIKHLRPIKSYKKIDFSHQYAKGIYTIKNRRIIRVALPVGFKQYGVASYYHSKFAGLKTSNGERLNLNALTAAHKTLPFNTLVKVTNLQTGRSVVVRINDRGPFVRGRIIDLSQKAAKKLGIYHKGVAKIKLEVVG